ncbi:MAG TPA: hypothetical protein VM238_06010 [Phycisphaerae bacterium]|nr:hypothetical protein [Phycisphaerae bacterium]
MRRFTAMMCLASAVLVGALCVGQAIAEEGAPPPPPGQERARESRGPRSPEEWRQRMEEFRQRMSDQMRERLGATEDEWKVLLPRIEKVTNLMRQGRGGFGGMLSMFGRGDRGRGGGDDRRPEGQPEREQSDVEMKTDALRSLLEDETSSAGSIKAALDALRKARQKSQDELALARKELREVVTARQEAQLVLTGLLD